MIAWESSMKLWATSLDGEFWLSMAKNRIVADTPTILAILIIWIGFLINSMIFEPFVADWLRDEKSILSHTLGGGGVLWF